MSKRELLGGAYPQVPRAIVEARDGGQRDDGRCEMTMMVAARSVVGWKSWKIGKVGLDA